MLPRHITMIFSPFIRQLGAFFAASRLAPACAFAVALTVLAVFCYESAQTSMPPTEKRYEAAKASIARLKTDEQKGRLREPWEKLAQEFQSIYRDDPAWPNRPAALFRAAESMEELAARSYASKDVRKAIEAYEALSMRHAGSRLADDALFRAARLKASRLGDDEGALALLGRLKKQYPKGDMLSAAQALEKAIRASRNGRLAPEDVRAAARGEKDPQEDQLPLASRSLRARVAPADDAEQLKRLTDTKKKFAALQKDPVRSCWRQPWENMRDEFLKIHEMRKRGKAADGALYNAGASQAALAECSRLGADYRKAAEYYDRMAAEYPKSALADDAMLAAADLKARRLGRPEEARAQLESIRKRYPQGDKAPEARKMLAALDTGASPRMAASAASRARSQVQVLSWDSPNRNSVEIVLELSGPARYSATLREGTGKSAPSVLLKLENASVVQDVRRGVKINGSLLKSVSVAEGAGDASLKFEFREVKKYAARALSDPPRIVLSVAAGKSALPRGSGDEGYASAQPKSQGKNHSAARLASHQLGDMASQLGLSVSSVFIDAGHGGKDPGTMHNSVVERQVALDVAQQLGALLQANGLEVNYSRRKDATLKLSERTRLANRARADIFISIHVNASENQGACGLETYYLDLASNPRAAKVAALENARSDKRLADMHNVLADVMLGAKVGESRKLAADIQRLALFRLKKRQYEVKNNGVRSAPFHVLIGAQMPAVLVELGYCTNPAEAKQLADPTYRHALAEGLAEGVLAYRDRLQRQRTAQKPLTSGKDGAI